MNFNLMSFLYIQYPSWLHPQIFPDVPVLNLIRWYPLMYIFAFGTAYILLKKIMKEGALNTPDYTCTDDDIYSFISTGIVFLIIGARVFATLVYNTSGLYWKKPWLIFWPFDTVTKKFTGLAGMSYHGGFIGGLLGMIFWCARHKKSPLQWIDAMALCIPLGYVFGRLGNFCNAELYGRITTMPWGVLFPTAQRFSTSLQWVQDFAAECGIEIAAGQKFVNLPRHPSQLYESFFEGIFLWSIMWSLRKKKPFHGFFSGFYTFGYGFVRFIIEYFREPDADLGYRISPTGDTILYQNNSLLNISTGQIFCFIMMLGGIVFWVLGIIQKKKEETAAAEKQNKKSSRKRK